jgi:hypothetical protein
MHFTINIILKDAEAFNLFFKFPGQPWKISQLSVECRYGCNISRTVQAAFFPREKACPELIQPDQLDLTNPPVRLNS